MLTACLTCILVVLADVGPARAKTFHVNSGFDVTDLDPGNGLCVAYILINPPFVLPFCTLRAAIQETNELPGPDIIELGSGTYRIGISGREEDLSLSGDFDITDSLQIIGAGNEQTFIDGAALDRVLDILTPGATVTLSGLSIINGRLPAGTEYGHKGGAGIRNQSILNLRYSVLTANTVLGTMDEDGGGAILNRGTCSLGFTTIQNNSARTGGGILNEAIGSLALTASTVSDNRAVSGAGIANFGTAALTNMTISNNIADSSDRFSGGGIYNDGLLQITQCTIADNSAPADGGIDSKGGLSMLNTLLAENPGGNCSPETEISSKGYNLDSDGSCRLDSSTDLYHPAPNLGPLRDNGGPTMTHAISYASAARDSGKTLLYISTDQRGKKRPVGSAYDIGSFETSPPVAPIISTYLLLKK